MNLSFVIQGKRQHEWVCHPTMSQEENDGDFDIFFPPTKRLRTATENIIVSPDEISDIDTPECDDAMGISIEAAKDGEPGVDWWKVASAKQAQQQLPMLNEDDLMCHVCDSIYKSPVATTSPPANVAAKAENSVLAYFKCTSKDAAKRIRPIEWVSDVKTAVSPTACTFCERHSCRYCLDCCEKCRKQFCRLCIRNDYLGDYSRVLCLDCAGTEDLAMNTR